MNRFRQILLCFLAVVMLLVPAGTVCMAENDSAEEGGTLSIQEDAETPEAGVEEITEFFLHIGEVDGYAVYLRPEDYKDRIDAATARQFRDEDARADAAKDLKAHLSNVELALIDSEQNSVAAELEEIGTTGDEVIYFSDAKRYLVFLNAERSRVLRIRYRVSTLDSEYLFLTKDKETLELYGTDYKSIRTEMKPEIQEQDKIIYRSSDQQYQAILNKDRNQALACVKLAAENERFRLYYDPDTAILALETKENGYFWWSSPLNANRDVRATKLLADELQSSLVLTYGDRNSNSLTTLRSRNSAELLIKEEANGITVTYQFRQCGISIPVRYALEEEYLSVSTDTAEIREEQADKGKIAVQMTLLGSFGAGGAEEEGYFVIPDGAGALIRFNNGKTNAKSYSAKVYGRDLTAVPNTRPAVTEQIHLPVYGIVKDGNVMTTLIEKGDGNAVLNASVSGQSLSSYNLCSFSFQLRGTDTYLLAGNNSASLTVFEDGSIKNGEIRMRYYPTIKENAAYPEVAEVYRNYLLSDGGVQKHTLTDATELYLSLYGGCMRTRSVLGIPVSRKYAVTDYGEAKEIISDLSDSGVEHMAVIYHNWTDAGISGKVDSKARSSKTLGGTKAFQALTDYLEEQKIAFYPSVNNKLFRSGGGYYRFSDTAIRISGAFSRQTQYTLSYGVQDSTKKAQSLLSPAVFPEIYSSLAAQYSTRELQGIALGEMTSSVWGDYGKQNMGRDDTIAALQESYQMLNDAGLSVLADSCDAYALPYADRLSGISLQSSGFDVFDEEIPFYQMVLHGVIPYAGTPINSSPDTAQALLASVAAGCNPAYAMIYAQANELKDTSLESYFYAHYAFWTDTAVQQYRFADDILSSVSDQLMTDYVRDGDISVTTYENGTEIIVDYAAETVTVDGKRYFLADYERGE